MILAAGLTPVWQQILLFERFTPGEVNRARAAHWCASGKSINVALALHSLGAPVHSLSLVGGQRGARIRDEFEQTGIAADWVESAAATRVCTTIVDQSTAATTELVENAGPVGDRELAQFRDRFAALARDAALVVLSGSLPPGAPSDFYAGLLSDARCPVILDARGAEMRAALSHRPLLVKPNREELGQTVARRLASDDDALAAMREINQAGAQWVVVTHGAGPVLVASAERAYRLLPEPIRPLNPIASGDSLAAGVAWGIAQGNSLPDAVKLGVAAAIENALTLLPARLDSNRVRERAARIELEEL